MSLLYYCPDEAAYRVVATATHTLSACWTGPGLYSTWPGHAALAPATQGEIDQTLGCLQHTLGELQRAGLWPAPTTIQETLGMPPYSRAKHPHPAPGTCQWCGAELQPYFMTLVSRHIPYDSPEGQVMQQRKPTGYLRQRLPNGHLLEVHRHDGAGYFETHESWRDPERGLGYEGNGRFCTLACGYQYGVEHATQEEQHG